MFYVLVGINILNLVIFFKLCELIPPWEMWLHIVRMSVCGRGEGVTYWESIVDLEGYD